MRERRIAPTSTTCHKSQQHEFRRRRRGVTPVGLHSFCVTPRRRHTTPQPGRGSTYRQRNAVQTKPATSVSMHEDASRVRKSPTILSILRSFALNILRFNKVSDVADALWRNAMNLNRALAYGGT